MPKATLSFNSNVVPVPLLRHLNMTIEARPKAENPSFKKFDRLQNIKRPLVTEDDKPVYP